MKYLSHGIKNERLKQYMSQKALCEGICSPSYLSKIENGSVICSDEIYTLLFDVLGIVYYSDQQSLDSLKQDIEELKSRFLLRENKEETKEKRELLKQQLDTYYFSNMMVDIILCRNLIHIIEYQKSDEDFSLLKESMNEMEQEQFY